MPFYYRVEIIYSIQISTLKKVGKYSSLSPGKPPDLVAFAITLAMTMVLMSGVKKSLFFNNVLNIINLSVWVFIMAAGLFYIDIRNWTDHKGFLPYGWSGVSVTKESPYYYDSFIISPHASPAHAFASKCCLSKPEDDRQDMKKIPAILRPQ